MASGTGAPRPRTTVSGAASSPAAAGARATVVGLARRPVPRGLATTGLDATGQAVASPPTSSTARAGRRGAGTAPVVVSTARGLSGDVGPRTTKGGSITPVAGRMSATRTTGPPTAGLGAGHAPKAVSSASAGKARGGTSRPTRILSEGRGTSTASGRPRARTPSPPSGTSRTREVSPARTPVAGTRVSAAPSRIGLSRTAMKDRR